MAIRLGIISIVVSGFCRTTITTDEGETQTVNGSDGIRLSASPSSSGLQQESLSTTPLHS